MQHRMSAECRTLTRVIGIRRDTVAPDSLAALQGSHNSKEFSRLPNSSRFGNAWPIECKFACTTRTQVSTGIHG